MPQPFLNLLDTLADLKDVSCDCLADMRYVKHDGKHIRKYCPTQHQPTKKRQQ